MRCPKCDKKMIVRYSRKERGYSIITRKCKVCGHREKTIEMLYSDYVKSVGKYNKIVEIIKD